MAAIKYREDLAKAYDGYERIMNNREAREAYLKDAEDKGIYNRLMELIKEREYKRAWIMDRNLNDYNRALKTDLVDLISKKEAEMRLAGEKGPVPILDIGIGNAFADAELKKIFGDRIHITGMCVAEPPEEVRKRVDRLFVGSIDFKSPVFRPNERYKVIIGLMGPSYAYSQAMVVQRICNMLGDKGAALVHLRKSVLDYFRYQNIADKLKASGQFRAGVFLSKTEKHYAEPERIICMQIERRKLGPVVSLKKEITRDWRRAMKKKLKVPLSPRKKGKFPKTGPSGG
ncbi:MAG: hypothetical protein V1676_04740 [Candidatus Diapherotrites archaeon]